MWTKSDTSSEIVPSPSLGTNDGIAKGCIPRPRRDTIETSGFRPTPEATVSNPAALRSAPTRSVLSICSTNNAFHRLALLALGAVALLPSPASADVVKLRHGGVVEGTIEERGDRLLVTTRFGSVEVARQDVVSIERKPTVVERYREKKAEQPPADADAHVALAMWCREHDYEEGARVELRAALERDPGHVVARLALGWERRRGQWISPEDLAAERRLERSAERSATERERLAVQHARREQQRLERQFRALAYGNRAACDRAYDELVREAKERDTPALAMRATEVRDTFESYWRRVRAHNVAVRADVRLTKSTVTRPIPSRTTGLGTGSPISIQLPQATVTSVRTTLWVPAGRGLTTDASARE